MAGRAVAICWQVLTKILIVIISWRRDLECFNFFFELLLLFKHFTEKWFVTCSVRDGSQILVYFFILQYPNSLDFHVLPIKVCNLINFLHLPRRTSVVSCQVWGISVGASPWELRNSDSTPITPQARCPTTIRRMLFKRLLSRLTRALSPSSTTLSSDLHLGFWFHYWALIRHGNPRHQLYSSPEPCAANTQPGIWPCSVFHLWLCCFLAGSRHPTMLGVTMPHPTWFTVPKAPTVCLLCAQPLAQSCEHRNHERRSLLLRGAQCIGGTTTMMVADAEGLLPLGTALHALFVSSHVTLTITLWSKHFYVPILKRKKLRHRGSFLKVTESWAVHQGFEPINPAPETSVLNIMLYGKKKKKERKPAAESCDRHL